MVLDEHRKNCEREGKLDEAQQARKRLKELRILEEQKRRVDTDQKHVSPYSNSTLFLTCPFCKATRNDGIGASAQTGAERTD